MTDKSFILGNAGGGGGGAAVVGGGGGGGAVGGGGGGGGVVAGIASSRHLILHLNPSFVTDVEPDMKLMRRYEPSVTLRPLGPEAPQYL